MSSLLSFFIAVVGLTLIPGATTLLVVRRTFMGGKRASLFTIAGGSLGVFVHALIAAMGLSILFQQSELLRVTVRGMGAAYLCGLGVRSLWRAWKDENKFGAAVSGLQHLPPTHTAGASAFAEGLITVLLSPETALFYLSALAQFISPSDWFIGKALLLASIHAGVRVGWYSLVAIFVSQMGAVLANPNVQQALQVATGALLILFALQTVLR